MQRLNTMYRRLIGARRAAAYCITAILLAASLIPLSPTYPGGTSLDNAWIMGLHEAVGRSLDFGSELVFTFGPYASVYTQEYHPATDHLMILGALVVALAFIAMVLSIARKAPWYWAPGFAFTVCVLAYSRDAQLIAFAPLTVMAIASVATDLRNGPHARVVIPGIVVGLTGVVLGLLPLIKGSLLPLVVVTLVLCTTVIAHRLSRRLAAMYLIIPIASLLFFWIIARQPLGGLGVYFLTQLQIISGYTDAMSSVGPKREWIIYLLACTCCLAPLARSSEDDRLTTLAIACAFAVFFFIAFKAGFVRHDGHVVTAASALLSGAVLGISRIRSARLIAYPLIAALCWFVLDAHYSKTSTDKVLARTTAIFKGFTTGLRNHLQTPEVFHASYESQLTKLATDCAIPTLTGTTDIYSYGQACLIAKRNVWSPRPVFQSYSAYTAGLAEINREHLLGPTAPDHVLFKIEPIDSRLPALEDGLSWPALLDKYAIAGFKEDYLLLNKRAEPAPSSIPEPSELSVQSKRLGETIQVPNVPGRLIFMSVNVRPTLLGRVASLFYKPEQLKIRIRLSSGELKEYRYIARMGEQPILISPLVATTRDFYLLAHGSGPFYAGNRVSSFEISPDDGPSMQWNDTIEIRYSTMPSPPPAETGAVIFDAPVTSWSGPKIRPASDDWKDCDWSIDGLNGARPNLENASPVGAVLSVEGWTAYSAKRGEPVDDTYLALVSKTTTSSILIKARATDRSDVARHFGHPALKMSGFSAYIDTSALIGEYGLGLVQRKGGTFVQCRPLIPLQFSQH